MGGKEDKIQVKVRLEAADIQSTVIMYLLMFNGRISLQVTIYSPAMVRRKFKIHIAQR